MTAGPLISVVIPTFNRLDLLRVAVASVLAQTYPNLEVIVADDGSEDGTVRSLEAVTDPRVRLVRLPHSGNISAVMNAGAGAARGDLLGFLNDDDLWEPEKLARQVDAMAAVGARWSYTGYALVNQDARERRAHDSAAFRPHPRGPLYGLLTTEMSATICSVVVERAAFIRAGGFDEGLALRADHDLVLRLAEESEPAPVPEPLVLIREHQGRTTAAARDPFRASAKVYDRYLGRPGPRPHAWVARRLRLSHLVSSARRASRAGLPVAAARTLVDCAWPGIVSARWWGGWVRLVWNLAVSGDPR